MPDVELDVNMVDDMLSEEDWEWKEAEEVEWGTDWDGILPEDKEEAEKEPQAEDTQVTAEKEPEEQKEENAKETEEDTDWGDTDKTNTEENKEKKDDAVSDEDLLKELEQEILDKADQGGEKQKAAENLADKVEEATADGKIDKEEYNALVKAHNDLVKVNEMQQSENDNMKELINRYKEALREQALNNNQMELDNALSKPILDVVSNNTNLKGFALAMNKVEDDPTMEDRALSYLYSYIQNLTGTDIQQLVNDQQNNKKAALSEDDTGRNAKTSVKEVKNNNDMEDLVSSLGG